MGMIVTIELVGTARIHVGRKEVSITVRDEATWRDVVAALAAALPVLVGTAITEDKRALVPPHLLSLGGRHTIENFDEEVEIKEGDLLLLFEETC